MIIAIIIIGVLALFALGVFIYVLCQMSKLVKRQEEWAQLEKDYYKRVETQIKDKGQS